MNAKVLSLPLLISVFLLAILNVFKLISGNGTIFGLSEYVSNAIIFFIAFAAIVAMLVLGHFVKINVKDLNLQKNTSTKIFAITSLFLAASIVFNSVYRLIDYLYVYRNIIQLVLSLFGILACITFVLIAYSAFKNTNIFKNKEYLTLFPVFWCIIRLYERYTVYSATSNLPWEMADEILIILGLVFLLYQAKIFANIESKNKFKNIITFGDSYIIFFTAFSIFSYLKESSIVDFSNNIIDLCMLVFIAFFISISKSSLSNKNTHVRDVLADDFDEKIETSESPEEAQN